MPKSLNHKVRVSIVFIFLVCVNVSELKSQDTVESYKPLERYDFDKGGYELIFLPYAGRNGDTAFFTTDISVLNELKEGWEFDSEAVQYPFACNDGHDLLLLFNGFVQDQFSIRNRCQAFIDGDTYWHLPEFSAALIPELLPVIRREKMYSAIDEARSVLRLAKTDSSVLFIEPADWESFEGYFFFQFPNPNKSGKAPFIPWENINADVQSQLDQEYLEVPFQMRMVSYGYGKNYPNIIFKVTANKDLFDNFKIFPIIESGWFPLKPKLIYYKKL